MNIALVVAIMLVVGIACFFLGIMFERERVQLCTPVEPPKKEPEPIQRRGW